MGYYVHRPRVPDSLVSPGVGNGFEGERVGEGLESCAFADGEFAPYEFGKADMHEFVRCRERVRFVRHKPSSPRLAVRLCHIDAIPVVHFAKTTFSCFGYPDDVWDVVSSRPHVRHERRANVLFLGNSD